MRRASRLRVATALASRALVALAALAALACGGAGVPEPGRLVPGELAFAPRVETVGAFELRLEGTSWDDARWVLVQRERPDAPIFATIPGRAFLEVARGRAEVVAGQVEDHLQERCADLAIDGLEAELYVLRLSGRLRCTVLDRAFEAFFVPEGAGELRIHVRLADASFNRIALVAARAAGERLHGLGARETLELEGRRIPVWVGHAAPEPAPPWARWVQRLRRAPAPDPPSPAPVPHLLSSRGVGLLLENPEYSVFDLRAPDRLCVEVFASELTFRLQVAASPLEAIALATAAAGRAEALPAWAHAGPLVVLGGGSAAVRRQLGVLVSAGVAPAALELRDWFGAGSLDPDPALYPDARVLLAELGRAGVRVIVGLDARIPEAGGDAPLAALRAEADAAGYWVRDPAGAPHARDGLRWIDLANPDARSWWVDALQRHVVDLGVAGFVVRGGDLLPRDAQLVGEVSAFDYHNRWATAGAWVARRALREAERPVDGLVLAETGFVRSPKHGVVLLAGDAGEAATWMRLLSAGLSGFAWGAVDVDGTAAPEVRARALGAAAFAPIFRVAAEPFAGAAALAELVHATRVHAAWAGLRAALAREAAERGAPLLRPVFVHHPDAASPDRGLAFGIGEALLVAPVFEPGAERVEVVLPAGRWIDAWSGAVHGLPDRGVRVAIDAPGGRAALLHREGSPVGRALARTLAGLSP